MSAAIEQFNLSYSTDEDRVLLRVRSSRSEEFRLWMTRRYTRLLLQVIGRTLRNTQDGEVPAQERINREAEIAFEHESATARADFATPYNDEADSYPLGESGVLGYRITVDSATPPSLHLLPREGPGLTFPAHPTLLHNLQHLLQQAIASAEWGLEEGVPSPPPGSTSRALN